MVTELKTCMELLNGVFVGLDSFAQGEKSEQHNRRSALLRAFFFECVHNESVLSQLKLKSGASFEVLRIVAPLLENEAGILLVYGEEAGGWNTIQDFSKLDLEAADEGKDSDEDSESVKNAKTLSEAVVFCVKRIDAVKTFARISPEQEEFFKQVNANVRLENILRYIKQIRATLAKCIPWYEAGACV